MKVIADICVVPITGRVSVREEVARAHQILKEAGLDVVLHAYGTNVEGELSVVLDAIGKIHEQLHEDGVPRLSTTIKLGSRIDKEQHMSDKVDVVQALIDP